MTEKPEWFELTADEPGSPRKEPRASKRSKNPLIRIIAVAVPLVIVGSAMVLAEGDSEAEELTTTAINQSAEVTNSVSAPKQSDDAPVANSNSNSNSNNSLAAPNAPTTPQKGLGVSAPTGNRDDDEGEEHEGREHEGREEGEHHERGEHRERGEHENAPKIPTSTKN